MPKKELSSQERIFDALFKDDKEAKIMLTVDELVIKKRYMAIFTKCLDNPLTPDRDLVNMLKNIFHIEKSQAYRDLAAVKVLLGNVKNAGKEWYRHICIQGYIAQYKKADVEGNRLCAIMALNGIGKVTKQDKDEQDALDWEKYMPPEFEISDDIKMLDENLFLPDIVERRKRLREKYNASYDVKFSDVPK